MPPAPVTPTKSGHDAGLPLSAAAARASLHAGILGAIPGVRVAGIVDPALDRAATAGKTASRCALRCVLSDLVQRTPVDAVQVACPLSLRAGLALDAMAKGLPTFIETPIAADFDAAERLLRSAQMPGAPQLFVSARATSAETFHRLAEILRQGSLGRLQTSDLPLRGAATSAGRRWGRMGAADHACFWSRPVISSANCCC